ncbi:L-threonylcarbamoyladenylate synthase [Nocardioides sp. Kera G14]|uniref:L-threonylcarbamoyladenylate synthase n=1 Tax=Nocardioides sp. Kera G14 TaxID=2884264 RepID=UPI001D126536|nr:L-threonylcarbamoyladenylate synthase [Nocardioides sp. Kera G14]UDY24723.1 threonylcarbamoyl-AMP synthase [Nocardioides sp. Kera G14]
MSAMAQRLPTTFEQARAGAISIAADALVRGELVVLPTDTVYGIGADAFNPKAVQALLDAKGRGRQMPPPVLVSEVATLDALATAVPAWARALADVFWPGPLTLVCREQSSLQWDLGETHSTVAIRVPDHPVALALLERTGPLAVSSANLTGQPAATDADAAEEMLGEKVAVILDDGATPGDSDSPSTIVDATSATPRLLRLGALSVDDLNRVLAEHGEAIVAPEAPIQ